MWQNCGVNGWGRSHNQFCGTSKKYSVKYSLLSQICELAAAGPNKKVSSKNYFFFECIWFKKSTLRPFFFSYLLFGDLFIVGF